MSNWINYLRSAEIPSEDWKVFQCVAWYCEKRKIQIPQGRCHFGEIALLYAPAYILLGHLYRITAAVVSFLWFGLIFLTTPIWEPVDWFGEKVDQYSRKYPGRATWVLVFALIVGAGPWLVYILATRGSGFIYVAYLAATVLPLYAGTFFILWIGEVTVPKVKPAFVFAATAATDLESRTSVKTATHVAAVPVKAVPATASAVWNLSAIVAALFYDRFWTRSICPRLSYGFDVEKYDFRPKDEPETRRRGGSLVVN